MKFFLSIFLCVFYLFYPFLAFSFVKEASFVLGTTYRQDEIKWHVSKPATNLSIDISPDTLLELDWKNISIWQIKGWGKYLTSEHVYVRLEVDYGWVMEGENNSLSRLSADKVVDSVDFSNKGKVYDLSAGLGYEFEFYDQQIKFLPILGYSYHSQHLPFFQYALLFELFALQFDQASRQTSIFQKSRWYGPWLGFDLSYNVSCFMRIFFSFEHHWGFYRASLSDFVQKAHGSSSEFSVGASYEFWENWVIALALNYKRWRTRIGTIEAFVLPTAENQNISELFHPLARVYWRSFSGSLLLGRSF